MKATFAETTRDHVFVYVRGVLVMKTWRNRSRGAHVWYAGHP